MEKGKRGGYVMSKVVKKLYRSREDRVLLGVCGGIGEYFGVDPVMVRLGAVLLFCLGGIGLITYIVAAIIVPEKK